jgi:hypothetical protein
MSTTKEVVEEFNKMTVPQLKSYAKKNKIDLFGATTKLDLLEAILPFVPRDDHKEIKSDTPQEKVAVFSERNLHWNGVGQLQKGYNIVTKEVSEKWLKHKAVREATPSEVAKHYGKS